MQCWQRRRSANVDLICPSFNDSLRVHGYTVVLRPETFRMFHLTLTLIWTPVKCCRR